jgi:hypothetical protein
MSRDTGVAATRGVTCEDCDGEPLVWFAPNSLWNRVKGGPDARDDPGGILCPNCFIRRAEAMGIKPTAWVLAMEDLSAKPTDADTVLSQFVPGSTMGPKDFSGIGQKRTFNALTYLARKGAIEHIGYGKYHRPVPRVAAKSFL